MGVFGEREAAFALNGECVAMLGWNRHPAFCIEID